MKIPIHVARLTAPPWPASAASCPAASCWSRADRDRCQVQHAVRTAPERLVVDDLAAPARRQHHPALRMAAAGRRRQRGADGVQDRGARRRRRHRLGLRQGEVGAAVLRALRRRRPRARQPPTPGACAPGTATSCRRRGRPGPRSRPPRRRRLGHRLVDPAAAGQPRRRARSASSTAGVASTAATSPSPSRGPAGPTTSSRWTSRRSRVRRPSCSGRPTAPPATCGSCTRPTTPSRPTA